jgi:hypothetical protein
MGRGLYDKTFGWLLSVISRRDPINPWNFLRTGVLLLFISLLHQPEFRVVDDSEKTGHQKAQPMKGLGL